MKDSDYCGPEEEKQKSFGDLPAPNNMVNAPAYNNQMNLILEESVGSSIQEEDEDE